MGFSQDIMCQQGVLSVPWEDTKIEIPIDLEIFKEVVIYRVIKDMKSEIDTLNDKLKELERKQSRAILYQFKEVTNKEAKEIISQYLKSIKNSVKKITIFEISQRLELPADQIEEVLDELEEEKKVTWEHE